MFHDIELQWAATYEYPLPWHLLPHLHSFYQLFYIMEGVAEFTVDGHVFLVEAGQSVVVPPNSMHEAKSVNTKVLRASEVMFRLKDEALAKRRTEMPLNRKENSSGYLKRYAATVSSADKGAVIG